jgi:lactate dehydrogenase-like 2-hydroxyacid dehydrogenase
VEALVARVVVLRWIPDAAMELLGGLGEVRVVPREEEPTREDVQREVEGAEAIVCTARERIDAALLDAAGPRLRVVATVAVGYDNIDTAAAAARGVLVTNTPGVLTDATADLTIGLMLMATRRMGEGERLIRARQPWSFSLGFMLGSDLSGKLLGIVGLGAIGRAVATRARAFGMRIGYAARHAAPPEVVADLDAQWLPQDELLASSDVVSLHCPLTAETHHLLDADALARMKPSAYLINTTRGPVVDEAALADALARGVIAGAALDVFEGEPEVAPRLLEAENVVLTPHIGSATIETRTAMAELAARNVVAVLSGEEPLTPVGG